MTITTQKQLLNVIVMIGNLKFGKLLNIENLENIDNFENIENLKIIKNLEKLKKLLGNSC